MRFKVINNLILKIKELFYSWKVKRGEKTTIGIKILIIILAIAEKFNKQDKK